MLPLQPLFAIIKLSHKQQGMGTIKMIGRLYQLGDKSSHLGAGQPQSVVGVSLVGGPQSLFDVPETESRREREDRLVLGDQEKTGSANSESRILDQMCLILGTFA